MKAIHGILVLALLAGCHRGPVEETWLEPVAAPDLDGLAVRHETPFRLRDQRGNVVLLAFGYTCCKDICPLTLAKLQTVVRTLGAEAGHVRVVYVSVDPERDQPPAFREFLQPFDPAVEGLLVEGDALAKLLAAYDVVARKRPPDVRRYLGHDLDPSFYSMDHSSGLFVIDPAGKLRIRYSFKAEPPLVVAGVRRLLEEGSRS